MEKTDLGALTDKSLITLLDAYKEGDIDFVRAKELILEATHIKEAPSKVDISGAMELMAQMYGARSRSEIWDRLHATEFSDESTGLDAVMASMTDAEVEEWFPRISTEFMMKQVGLL